MSEEPRDTDYVPIACDIYSQFELFIMHKERLQLHWHDEEGICHIGVVHPVDLETRRGEEFMIVLDAQRERLEIRLDRVLGFRPMSEQQ